MNSTWKSTTSREQSHERLQALGLCRNILSVFPLHCTAWYSCLPRWHGANHRKSLFSTALHLTNPWVCFWLNHSSMQHLRFIYKSHCAEYVHILLIRLVFTEEWHGSNALNFPQLHNKTVSRWDCEWQNRCILSYSSTWLVSSSSSSNTFTKEELFNFLQLFHRFCPWPEEAFFWICRRCWCGNQPDHWFNMRHPCCHII